MKLKTINSAILLMALIFALGAVKVSAHDDPASGTHNHPIVKSEVESRKGTLEERKAVMLEKKAEIKDLRASTSAMLKDARGNMKEERKEMKEKMASSSPEDRKEMRMATKESFKKMKDDRKEMVKKMQKGAFDIRKAALLQQLNISLTNLSSIRTRINDKITSLESEGSTMTDAKAALATADDRLAKAKVAVEAFSALSVKSTDATATSSVSTDIELEKPRQLGDAAIKAVKEAREALRAVVKFIAPTKSENTSATSTITN